MHALGIRIRFSSASISYFFQHGYLFGHFTFHFYSLFFSFSQLLCFVFLHIFDWLTDSYLSLFCTVVLCVKFHKVVAPARASVLCRPVDFWISSCSGSSMRIKRIRDFWEFFPNGGPPTSFGQKPELFLAKNSNGAMWFSNLVMESIAGSVVSLAMFLNSPSTRTVF